MKSYIKLIAIAFIVIITTTLSAQQVESLDNQMPKTWEPDLSNSYARKTVNTPQVRQYTPAELSKGRQYNVINTETKINTPSSATLQNNTNNSYYRSYGVNHNGTQNVTYNTPTQVKPITSNTSEATPFEDAVITGDMMHVKRDEKPNDPAPIGDATLPLLLIVGAYVILKLKIKN